MVQLTTERQTFIVKQFYETDNQAKLCDIKDVYRETLDTLKMGNIWNYFFEVYENKGFDCLKCKIP